MPFILTALLGLNADGFARRPLLPPWVAKYAVHDMNGAAGGVSLRFARDGQTVRAEPVTTDHVEVVVE